MHSADLVFARRGIARKVGAREAYRGVHKGTELIAEMGLALDQELTIDEIHATIHAHPTMSEVIHEATLAAEGHAIHF